MGRYFALTLGYGSQATHPKSQIQSSKLHHRSKEGASRINLKGIFLALVLLVFGIVYLVQVNTISTKGYDIKKLQQKLSDLKETNKRLELEVSSTKAIQNLETTVKSLNLVPSGAIKYVNQSGYAFEN